MEKTKKIDWQGHRGARGLVPENTIPSFIKALEYPVSTLELDVVVSKDGQLILSHEPWMSHHICSHPDGRPVTEEEDRSLNIYQMTYNEIKSYDCGSRGNERFPEQGAMKVHKPSLKDMVQAVEAHCKKEGLSLPSYNIEMKSYPPGDSIYHPIPEVFAQIMVKELKDLGIEKRANVQSFDIRCLEAVRAIDKSVVLAYLVEGEGSFEERLKMLSFQPEIYSPEHILVNPEMIKKAGELNMKVIPWTINDKERMEELIELGVDGIITDYPNLIEKVSE